jgi:hypothetical protein
MRDVVEQFHAHHEANPNTCLYALVDGLQYEACFGERIDPDPTKFSLFQGTQDEALAYAGGWLFDLAGASAQLMGQLAQLEKSKPAVSWLFSKADLHGLGQLLQLRLNAHSPDGQAILLRIYDPRVLYNLFHTLHEQQRTQLCEHIDQWHFMHKGQRQSMTQNPTA